MSLYFIVTESAPQPEQRGGYGLFEAQIGVGRRTQCVQGAHHSPALGHRRRDRGGAEKETSHREL